MTTIVLTTTATAPVPLYIGDLGDLEFNHPQTSTLSDFLNVQEIYDSADLQSAINSSHITFTYNGASVTNIQADIPEPADPSDAVLPATESQRGIIQLASAAEVAAGTNTEKAVTPATLPGASAGKRSWVWKVSRNANALSAAIDLRIHSQTGMDTGVMPIICPVDCTLWKLSAQCRVNDGGWEASVGTGTPPFATTLDLADTVEALNSAILSVNFDEGDLIRFRMTPSGAANITDPVIIAYFVER